MALYKIKCIDKVTPPEGTVELRWYKFVLENDKNTITNFRAGSKKEVVSFALESVKRLNEKYFTHVQFKQPKPVFEMEQTNYLY